MMIGFVFYLSLLQAKCHQFPQPLLLVVFSRLLMIFVPFLYHITQCALLVSRSQLGAPCAADPALCMSSWVKTMPCLNITFPK